MVLINAIVMASILFLGQSFTVRTNAAYQINKLKEQRAPWNLQSNLNTLPSFGALPITALLLAAAPFAFPSFRHTIFGHALRA